jgi:hypothetical protein
MRNLATRNPTFDYGLVSKPGVYRGSFLDVYRPANILAIVKLVCLIEPAVTGQLVYLAGVCLALYILAALQSMYRVVLRGLRVGVMLAWGIVHNIFLL